MASTSPVHKRPKLDPSASPSPPPASSDRSISLDVDGEEDEDHCVICLHPISDRTVLPCAHDRLCFDCIFVWCQQSRKCPLCNAPIGPFLIHNFRTKYDYSKYFLPPLRISSPTSAPVLGPLSEHASAHPRVRRSNRWGSRRQNGSASRERRETADELELAIERRRWVYRHDLYAKHVASNPYTRYRPAPTPPQIAASPDLISRATIFVRRELRVWVNLDVEFLTTFILSLMKTLDLRSESAVKLLAEFLDMDTPYYVGDLQEPSAGRFANAERFSHELYSYLRSPFRDLAAYDAVVQVCNG
ncbi:hypothetical protein JB92DRAFT_2714966 [Gautieria morchelliformis]|nr:hypothetical protein JB92DRAFT_2714966 [Gautieria morchelliformis]